MIKRMMPIESTNWVAMTLNCSHCYVARHLLGFVVWYVAMFDTLNSAIWFAKPPPVCLSVCPSIPSLPSIPPTTGLKVVPTMQKNAFSQAKVISTSCMVVCGQFTGTLTHKQSKTSQGIFVVKELEQALMGRPAIEALHLISRVNFIANRLLCFIAANTRQPAMGSWLF